MSTLTELARAVADTLSEYGAEVSLHPEFSLRETDKMRVVVVPSGMEYKAVSRDSHQEMPRIQVGVTKRCAESELEGMLSLAETLGLGFLDREISGAVCVGVAYNPIYSPEMLRERRQFLCVIELTFKAVKR